MANEFIARKGLIALQNSSITGSLDITGSLTSSNDISSSGTGSFGYAVLDLQDTTANNPDYVVVDPSGNLSKKRSDGKTSPLITYQYKTSGASPAAGEIIDKVFVGGTYQLLIATASANNVDIDPSNDFFYTNVGSIIKLTSTSSGNFQMAKLVNNVVEESGYYQFLYTNAHKISSGTIANNDIVNFEWDKSAGVGEGFSPSSNATTKTLANFYIPGYNYIDSFFGRFSTTDGTPQTLTNVDESGSFTETFYFLPAIADNESLTLGNISASGEISASKFVGSELSTPGDLTLDADGADILLKDGGTEFGRFKRDSSDFVIKSATNDKDIVFRGIDNTATITALTLDMSEGGKALFGGDIDMDGNSITMGSGEVNGAALVDASAFKMGNGSAGTPALAFTGDTNTGLYAINVDTLGIAAGGQQKVSVGSTSTGFTNNNVTIDSSNGTGAIFSVTNTYSSINPDGAIAIKGTGCDATGTPGGQTKSYGGYFLAGDTNTSNPDTIALYAQGHEDGAPNSYAAIFSGSTGGVVGINTMEPTVELDVVGDISASGDLSIRGFSSVSASLASSGGGSATTYRTVIESSCFFAQNTLRYLPFNSLSEQSGFNYLSITPAAADGKLVSLTMWPQSSGGSTVVGLHINSNSTAATTDTQTISAGTPLTFTFSSNNTFSQNDELSFSVNPTNIINGMACQIVLEYDL